MSATIWVDDFRDLLPTSKNEQRKVSRFHQEQEQEQEQEIEIEKFADLGTLVGQPWIYMYNIYLYNII